MLSGPIEFPFGSYGCVFFEETAVWLVLKENQKDTTILEGSPKKKTHPYGCVFLFRVLLFGTVLMGNPKEASHYFGRPPILRQAHL